MNKEIGLSRLKLIYLTFIYFMFFLCCFFFMFFSSKITSTLFKNELIIKLIGIIGFPFIFLMFLSFLIKSFDKKKGVIITNDYLIDNSTYESIGKISWKDIKKVNKVKVYSGSYLELDVFNKSDYLKNRNLNL